MKYLLLGVAASCMAWTSGASAQERIEYNCGVTKIVGSLQQGIPTFEDLGQFSGSMPLALSPSNFFAGQAVYNAPTTPAPEFTFTLEGEQVTVRNALSAFLIRPNRRIGNRWGVCQFDSHIEKVNGQGYGLASSNFGASTYDGKKVRCETLLINNGEEFSASNGYSKISVGNENVIVGCAYKLFRK